MDDFDWIRDSIPVVPITELGPNDRFKIVDISGKALKDYLGDFNGIEPHKTIFRMDEKDCFTSLDSPLNQNTDYVDNDTTDVWLMTDDEYQKSSWVSINTIMVIKI